MGLRGKIIQGQIQNKNNYVSILNISGRGILKVLFFKEYQTTSFPRIRLTIDGSQMELTHNIISSYITSRKTVDSQNKISDYYSYITGGMHTRNPSNEYSYQTSGQMILNLPFTNSLKIEGKSQTYGYGTPTHLYLGANYVLEV